MIRKSVNLRDFAGELDRFTDKHLVELRNATARGVLASIPDLVRASPVDTGLYAQSWDMTVGEFDVTIGNSAPHAAIIEHGARPFTPPLAPLLAWAKRVTGSGSQPPDYDDHVWALAIYTQKKIAAEGMKPRHILTNMIPTIIENIRQEYRRL